MAPFFLVGYMRGGVPHLRAYDSQSQATRAFIKISQRAPAVLMAEPGHKMLDATQNAARVQIVREAATAAVAGAAYVVAAHVGFAQAAIYGPDGEADASRDYAGIHQRYAKAMWAAESDTAVAAYGGDKWVGICSVLARSVLAAATPSEADDGDTTVSTPAGGYDEGAPPGDADVAYWMVGQAGDDGPRFLAYDSEARARQAFAAAARQSAAVLMVEPDNNVLDSAGDDAAVQEVATAIAIAAAATTYAVAKHIGYTVATIYTDDSGEAAARCAYDAISRNHAKAMCTAGRDTPVEKYGGDIWAGLCSKLALAIVGVAALSRTPVPAEGGSSDAEDGAAPSPANGTADSESLPAMGEATYWLVGTTVARSGAESLKAYDSAAMAQRAYDKAKQGQAMSALVLISQPGLVVLDSLGDAGPVEECRQAAEDSVIAVHRVVSWYAHDHTEACLFTYRQEGVARSMYTLLSRMYPRSMWTADRDNAVATYGHKMGVEASSALASAILTIADTPPPAVVGAQYYTVASFKNGEVTIKAYATEANARIAFQRLDADTPRALASQPGNRPVESSPGDEHASILTNMVVHAAGKAATSVRWVAVSRVWERAEASLMLEDTASEAAAVAAYNRMKGPRARGVWGADSTVAIKSRGWETWLGRCEALAAAILRREE